MTYAFDKTKNVLTLTPKSGSTLEFTDFTDISFGNSKRDINWCSPTFFNYEIASDLDLSRSMAYFQLEHSAKVFPPLLVKVARMENDYVHIEMDYAQQPDDFKAPFNPDLDLAKMELSESPLSEVFALETAPLKFKIGLYP